MNLIDFKSLMTILSFSLFFLTTYTSNAFTIKTPSSTTSLHQQKNNIISPCSQSHLFRSTLSSSLSSSSKFDKLLILPRLQMTTDNNQDNNNNNDEEDTTSTASSDIVDENVKSIKSSTTNTSKDNDNRNAIITALVLGPPLIAKFGIVILVKIATDLVVFPLLFTYRFLNLMKNKVVGLFTSKDAFKGEKINGSSK